MSKRKKMEARGFTPIEAHRYLVATFMGNVIVNLTARSAMHDNSKQYNDDEKSFFSTSQPTKYMSDEYKKHLNNPAILSHYKNNDHHPEHFSNGVNDMSLLTIIEMLCDWLAGSTYRDDGNFEQALETNFERFKIEPQLKSIIIATLKELGYYPIDSSNILQLISQKELSNDNK